MESAQLLKLRLQKPDITKEDFIKGFRFARIPKQYMGEAFTKAKLHVYLLMKTKDEEEPKLRLYKSTYEIGLTAKFLNKSFEAIELKGRDIEVTNPKKLSDAIVNWEGPKTFDMNIDREFDADFEQVRDELLDLEIKAIERGWIKC